MGAISNFKDLLGLNLPKEVKEKTTTFLKCISSKRNNRKNVGPLVNGKGAPVTEDAGKAELLDAFFS